MPQTITHRIAIYDMDKTITRKATFGPFIAHVIRRHAPWRVVMLPLMGLVTLAYALKLVSRAQLKQINLALLLGSRIDRHQAARVAEEFALATRRENFLSEALRQIAQDRADGYLIVLATASYQFYVQPIAALLGIEDVIATRCHEDGPAHFRAAIKGGNCYGPAKLTHVTQWLSATGMQRNQCHIRFYSDHVSDAPCLEWADQAIAANPHAPLRRLAEKSGWRVCDWAVQA